MPQIIIKYISKDLMLKLPLNSALRKKCPYSELFWSACSRIRTEYGEIFCQIHAVAETHLESSQTSNMEPFVKLVNG